MELWIDNTEFDSLELSGRADRIWDGDAPDVAKINLDDHEGQKEAISLIGLAPWILLICSNWKMIPLENLISKSSGTGTKIAVSITEEIEILGVSFALQHGVDALLLPPNIKIWNEAEKVKKIKKDTSKSEVGSEVVMSTAKITSIVPGGFGERVCIDLIERLKIGEGMLIGSVSEILCFVHGETISSEFVPKRQFRVNAGAIHSYILMASGKTKYLSELLSGDEVSIMTFDGNERHASIGRIKIERRPFLKIGYENNDISGNIIVQQAETVRIITDSEKIKSVTDLEIGDKIIVRMDPRVRHIGNPLKGDIREL